MLIRSAKELALAVTNQRKKLKISQAEAAKRVGLKQQTISEFEIKPDGTKLGTLFHILSAVNLDIKVLPKGEAVINEAQWKEEW